MAKKRSVNPHWLPIVCSISLALNIFLGGFVFLTNKQQRAQSQRINLLEEELRDEKAEMAFRASKIGRIAEEKQLKYDFRQIKLYSPEFENKQVVYRVYQHQFDESHLYQILDNSDGIGWSVDIWSGVHYYDGYENYALQPTLISEITSRWEDTNKFVNREFIPMYWSYTYSPKSISAVVLEFIEPYNKQFVRISMPVNTYPNVFGEQDPEVIATKKRLQEFADTISYRFY